MIITKTYKDIKPVLMENGKIKVKDPYYIIQTEGQAIFIISTGLNGSEYNKTVGFISNYQGVQTYQCLYGQGVLLMQRNDERGEAKEFKVVTLSAGRQISVPAYWVTCLVNIGKTYLVVLANIDIDSEEIETKPIIEKRGLAYYIVEKKGEAGFEQNPNYSVHPQITTE